MENEIQILKIINGELTQRDIARRTGMSLGSVNLIIKRLIKKGLIKVEKINKKNLKYILTPEGAFEKAKATYKYVLDSFNYIYMLNLKIDNILNEIVGKGYDGIAFLNRNDEIEKIIIEKLSKNSIKYVRLKNELNEINNDKHKNYVAVVWNPDDIKEVSKTCLPIINLMDIA